MNPLSDPELQRHLARRTSRTLPTGEREEMLAEVSAARARRRFLFGSRHRMLLAPLAAFVLVVLVSIPLLMTLAPGPSSSPSPTTPPPSAQASASTPTPSSEPEATAPPGLLDVLTQDELIALSRDPSAAGRVVMARAEFAPVPGPTGGTCPPPDACYVGQIGINPGVVVFSGWRDSPTERTGTYYEPYGRWLVRLESPPVSEANLMAFRIRDDASVEFLGAVAQPGSSLVWSPADIPNSAAAQPADDVYIVSGWLVRTQEVPCPRASFAPNTDLSYDCGGSFITATSTAIADTRNALDPGGLHVQWDAFLKFPPNPTPIEVGLGPEAWTSDRAIYLVRPVGERMVTIGSGHVWRLIDRLDPPMSEPGLSPSPSPAVTPSSPLQMLTQDELVALANDPAAKDRFVVAAAQIQLAPVASADCIPFDPCYVGHIGDNPAAAVYEGWRDATDEGTGTFDTVQGRWLVRLELPSADAHLMAFRIGHQTVEYLGDAQLADGSLAWSVNDLMAQADPRPDQVYGVEGWLVHTPAIPCPAPESNLPDNTDLGYFCGGSFITSIEAAITDTHDDIDPGGIHVQSGAYDHFAPNSSEVTLPDRSTALTSDRAVYLVRPVGERYWEPLAWRLVGRTRPASKRNPEIRAATASG